MHYYHIRRRAEADIEFQSFRETEVSSFKLISSEHISDDCLIFRLPEDDFLPIIFVSSAKIVFFPSLGDPLMGFDAAKSSTVSLTFEALVLLVVIVAAIVTPVLSKAV